MAELLSLTNVRWGRSNQKIKLSDIADTLGVSTATVSLALRDSPCGGGNREKIKKCARDIGHIYNRRLPASEHQNPVLGRDCPFHYEPFYAEILGALGRT